MKEEAAKFLRTGKIPDGCDPAELAEACRKEVHAVVQRSTREAIKIARRFVQIAEKQDQPVQLAAYRALGWALHVATRTTDALRAYLQARRLAYNKPLIRAGIDRILIDIYMYLGDFEQARRYSRLSMATFRRHGAITEMEKTRVNFANLLHRQDKHRQAQHHYHRAGEHMARVGEKLVLGLCQYNEANTLVQLIEFDRAQSLYESAEKIFIDLTYDLYANEARYGRAWLAMLRGDYHGSLKLLAECDDAYRRHGQPRGRVLCDLDRAEAFIGLNLMTDARDAAEKAERCATRLKMTYEAAKAALFLAKAAYATGHTRTARTALKRATKGFRHENNRPFTATTQFTEALMVQGVDKVRCLARARDQFRLTQLPVWEAVCDLTLMIYPEHEEAACRRLRKNASVRTIPYLMAHWETALGDREARRNHWSQARSHWTRAADVLDEVRAMLPPVEMRAAFLKGRTEPYQRLVVNSIDKNPAAASAWSERFNTAGLWAPLAGNSEALELRDRAREKLTDLAQQVTALASVIERGSGQRVLGTIESDRALINLEREVRRNLAEIESRPLTQGESIERLIELFRSESRYMTIVQFHLDLDDLIAFVHHNGEVAVHRYVMGRRRLGEYVGWWQTLLSQQLFDSNRKSYREEDELFDALGGWLWEPLEIPKNTGSVLILPTGQLADLPWPAIRIGGEVLSERYHLVLAPSLRHHRRAARLQVDSERVEVLVGRADDLLGVDEDIAVLRKLAGNNLKVYNPAHRTDWPAEGESRILHYSGHARLRRDNPFYSSLLLDDGPLFAADFRLFNHRVDLVTLAACRTGVQSYLPGEESSGLVRSLLEMGARNVLAGLWAVDDRSTGFWMKEFYSRLFTGESILEAVRSARRATRRRFRSAYHWAAFGIFGACRGDNDND
ncbi:MAG TPA: CHAT domain-containing protein [candidate division Zixibacteria bacterium]|nr:CHAT domain-containing protein [candidate division Zixibacteria bacterium]